jgi:flagellar protein FliS
MYSKKAYLETRVKTASKSELLVMLYDGLVRFVAETERAIREKRPADAGRANGRALDIISHLVDSLRSDVAPDLCAQLRTMYLKWSQLLVRSLAHGDADGVASVLEQVQHMRDCWAEAAKVAERGTAGAGSGTLPAP